LNLPVPEITLIQECFAENPNLEIRMLRLDMIHPVLNGNKGYKLKYNIRAFQESDKQCIVSFGGAYSNHLAALAGAGKLYGIPTIGIIRGEEQLPLNLTLSLAASNGMELHYVSRTIYRDKNRLNAWAETKFGKQAFFLPEGGSNELAVKGCMEILDNVSYMPDFICCPCGTGATIAGIASSQKGKGKTIGFSALKDISFFEDTLESFAGKQVAQETAIIGDYHFGGYAKVNQNLTRFTDDFLSKQKVQLDYIYTAKMMYGIYDLVRKGYFKPGTKILAVHTGGVQGNADFVK
jgi:1-aminocyclopropane-1-carboxylate deaminase